MEGIAGPVVASRILIWGEEGMGFTQRFNIGRLMQIKDQSSYIYAAYSDLINGDTR